MTSRHGLANLGNTCYLNSAFQALRRTNSFVNYLGSKEWSHHRHENRRGYDLATEAVGLMEELRTSSRMIIPRKFLHAFILFAREFNDEIQNGAQADAAEAIQILLDGLHMQHAREVNMEIKGSPADSEQEEIVESLKSWSSFFSKEYSPFVDEFYGQTRSQFICECGARRTVFEPWSVLKVEIPGAEKAGNPAPNLKDCIASAFRTETLDDYACDTCKKRGTTRKEQSISRFPQTLILSLKRFTNAGSKVRARISYDENCVDMSEWVSWSTDSLPQQYRVVSTIEHLGSSRGGHYIMRAKESDGWFIYDDSNVLPCREGGGAGPDTYILFLQKIQKI